MGYNVDASGEMLLRKDTPQPILDRLKEIAEEIFSEYSIGPEDDNFKLSATLYDKYYEDSVFEFFATAEPYTVSGEFEYMGEDGSAWEHLFDEETKKWLELPGQVVYLKEQSAEVLSLLKNDAKRYPNWYKQYLDRVEETKTEEFLSQTPAHEIKPEAKPEDVNHRNFVEEVTRIRTIQFGNDSSEKWKEPDDE